MKPESTDTQAILVDEVQQTLYAKRQKIYPRATYGLFARLKISSRIVLLSIYYLVPWLQWNGQQAVLFDLPARQFHILEWTFWPQDFIYLAWLLIIAGLSLFFFTAIAGRLWCGFACPQTVWTDMFLWMERLVEGDRAQQIKLDKTPFTWQKFQIKAKKHSLWIIFAFFTGFTFVGYFLPIRELANNILMFRLSGWETFWLLFYSFATYGNAGWLREQVCIYMCPYARFQSAMFDQNTLIIAYDNKRGEPRGSRRRNEDYKNKGLGECINCTMCIQVCPTGIDIREGLQYKCISCSACIDVCNDVMKKMNYAQGLIRYTTENAVAGKPTQILRPRIFVYGVILLGLLLGLSYTLSQRVPLQLDVLRDRNSLFKETGDGLIQNVYLLKVMNKDHQAHVYDIAASGIQGLQLEKDQEIRVNAGNILEIPIRLLTDPVHLQQRSTPILLHITARDNPQLTVTEDTRFLGPVTR